MKWMKFVMGLVTIMDCNLFLVFYFICNICKVYNNMYLFKSNGVISMEDASL